MRGAEQPSLPPPQHVGISLSGGGLRAAAFGLGAMQELDARFTLLRGESSARWLSAVSGGSYIASTFALANAGIERSTVPASRWGQRRSHPASGRSLPGLRRKST